MDSILSILLAIGLLATAGLVGLYVYLLVLVNGHLLDEIRASSRRLARSDGPKSPETPIQEEGQ